MNKLKNFLFTLLILLSGCTFGSEQVDYTPFIDTYIVELAKDLTIYTKTSKPDTDHPNLITNDIYDEEEKFTFKRDTKDYSLFMIYEVSAAYTSTFEVTELEVELHDVGQDLTVNMVFLNTNYFGVNKTKQTVSTSKKNYMETLLKLSDDDVWYMMSKLEAI